MGRLIWTILVSVGVLYLAQKIGWIGLGSEVPSLVANTIWNNILWFGIIAVAFTVVSVICGKIYRMVTVLTCGVAFILIPVYLLALGYVQLLAAAYIIPGFTYTHVWWQVLLLSVFVGIGAASQSSTNKSSSSSD